ncbi:amidohydrolase family protein [Streptomyces sp. NPDC048242]|uniref:amidohydrolase family protein n=1 Tax=Streptomyces sp. NPDC048242 TaxID=3155026 RepID=UPI00342DD38F
MPHGGRPRTAHRVKQPVSGLRQLSYARLVPGRARHELRRLGQPAWSPESAIAMMDAQGIATGVMSVTSPGVHLGDDADARDLARAVNEYGAEVVKDNPDRFGHFASIPLPDIDAAVAEAVYALDVLGADGVVLMSNAHGKYLGDADFEPLWAELDRRSANVFVHPAQPPMTLLPGTPASRAAPTLRARIPRQRHAAMPRTNGAGHRHVASDGRGVRWVRARQARRAKIFLALPWLKAVSCSSVRPLWVSRRWLNAAATGAGA